ncbi:MAG TPA: hypothetical protein VFF65_03365 [Phycisphaerales bacterium]|nr:hypothetical protein [Phycisphaerales bacterium]
MSNLRLVDNNGAALPTDRLPFPTEAVRQLSRQRLQRIATKVSPSRSGVTPEGFEAFTREIEQRLALAEEQLNALREQVDSYPIFTPGPAGGGGRAA